MNAKSRKPAAAKKPTRKAAKAATAADVGNWRFYFVLLALCSLLALLVGRVLSLQVLETDRGHDFLQQQGDRRAVRHAEIPAYRGVITDRRGEPLAVSSPVVSLWADPQRLADSTRIGELAAAIGVPEAELHRKLKAYSGKRFMYLKRKLNPEQAREILAAEFKGVSSEREYQRFYPAAQVTSQLVGFTNIDGKGIAGLELAYDEYLRGHPGRKQYIQNRLGNSVRDIGVLEPPRPGSDLRLSIDLRLQYLQYRELKRAVTTAGAASGSAVTVDARTGEVLAMANYPVYNPNSRRDMTSENQRNRAITDAYEPGSTMKTLTMVAALESGRYSVDTLIDTAPGWMSVAGKGIKDPLNYGEITVSRVIEKSSQVGITKIALDIGHEPIFDVFSRFGIGRPPATGFPGEASGLLPNRTRWYATEKLTLAYGYGISATPLQLARAYGVFANDGVMQPLSLLALEGDLLPGERVISAELAHEVLGVLEAVTGEHGTAGKASVPGHAVGGKTGTVRKLGPEGYSEDRHIALFAGVAPIDDPRIVTVVVINDAEGEDFGGGAAAAPVFGRVTEGALRLLGVTPQEAEVVASVAATGLSEASTGDEGVAAAQGAAG
ncbi:MAG: penicillin-binding transpeptidase domain-containing protein [Pseudomonadota bacterium]